MYQFDWGIVCQSPYVGWLVQGLWITLKLSFTALILATILGTLVAVMRTYPNRMLNNLGAIYVECFRNIPLIVQLFFWYFAIPG